MMRYRSKTLRENDPPGSRVVHNFLANGRAYGVGGYRYWVTDDPQGHRCYCEWIDGEHYGVRQWIDADGVTRHV